MFTGIVETAGSVRSLEIGERKRSIWVDAPGFDLPPGIGDSIAVDGCCLTAAEIDGTAIRFDLLDETLRCTNLGGKTAGSRVNLERALAADGRLAGHFVQGHVDRVAAVVSTSARGPDLGIEIEAGPESSRYLVNKGSVALNGVSLTVASIAPGSFTVWIIPHTRSATNLGDLAAGDAVNLEFDVLAKYVERLIGPR